MKNAKTDTSDRAVRPPARKQEIDFNETLNENPTTGAMYTVLDLFDDLIQLVRVDMQRELGQIEDRYLGKKKLFSSLDSGRRYMDVLQALAGVRAAWSGLIEVDLQQGMETLVEVLGS